GGGRRSGARPRAPGMAPFRRTFSVAARRMGRSFSADTPSRSGPRHPGQSARVAEVVSRQTRAAKKKPLPPAPERHRGRSLQARGWGESPTRQRGLASGSPPLAEEGLGEGFCCTLTAAHLFFSAEGIVTPRPVGSVMRRRNSQFGAGLPAAGAWHTLTSTVFVP